MGLKQFLDKVLRGKEGEAELPQESETERKEMIKGVRGLSNRTVKEVMVPRIDVVFVSEEMDEQELQKSLLESGHSRVPVFRETIDQVTGILYVKDLFAAVVGGSSFSVREIARPPYFVPDTMRLNMLLHEFQKRKVHIAVAVDEYGGVSGIVCLEDIIEEIVGDIQDEFDDEGEEIEEVGSGVYLCDARCDLETLNERIDARIPSEDFDTLGGFVFDLFGRIPARSEKASYEDLEFTIQEVEGHRISKVRIERKQKGHDEATSQ